MYFNEYFQLVSAASGSATFSTSVPMNGHDMGGIEFIWTAHNAGGATFHLAGSIASGSTGSTLVSSVITLTSGSGNQVYNIGPFGLPTLTCVYNPGSNTAGTVDVWYSRKGSR